MIKLITIASAVVLSSSLHIGLHVLLVFAAVCIWHFSLKFYLLEAVKSILSISSIVDGFQRLSLIFFMCMSGLDRTHVFYWIHTSKQGSSMIVGLQI